MAVLLESRTISMILNVPDVDVVPPSSTPIIERLDRSDTAIKHGHTSDSDTTSSMPVYQGSIVRIEPHTDDQNVSDLIIRVPNFQRLSSPSSDTDSKSSTRIKRRAPICPLLYAPTPNLSTTNDPHHPEQLNLSQTRVVHTNRLATGLRSLSRAFTHGCRSKRSTSSSETTAPSPPPPDVEVMNEKLQASKSSNKNSKYPIPKLHPPKILSIKRKKQPSSPSVSNDTRADLESNQINLTPNSRIITTRYTEMNKHPSVRVTSFLHRFVEQVDSNQETNTTEDNDDDREQQNETIRLSFDVEQQFAAISQLVSDNPVSSIDADSLSTHRYSIISTNVPDIRVSLPEFDREDAPSPESLLIGNLYNFDLKPPISSAITPQVNRPFRIQTSTLQPDISVIRIGTSNLTTDPDRLLPGEQISMDSTSTFEPEPEDEDQIEQGWYGVIHPDDETFAECYEVIYQIDSRYQNEKEQQIVDQSSVLTKISIDPFEYKNLASTGTISEPRLAPHEYEQVNNIHQNDRESQQSEQRDQSLEHLETISNEQHTPIHRTTRRKSLSCNDLSPANCDQTSTYQPSSIAPVSSTSDDSSRHCTLRRSDSYNGFGIHISTDIKTRRDHFIRDVEESSPGEQAGLKENDRILCINGTPVIQEDYTVVLQLIKHGLHEDSIDFDVITNDAYEQFKSEIDQLYQ